MTGTMYDEPYLETCCRAALHRLFLAGPGGRPGTEKDKPCLERLLGMGLVCVEGAMFQTTPAGKARHAAEVLGRRGQD